MPCLYFVVMLLGLNAVSYLLQSSVYFHVCTYLYGTPSYSLEDKDLHQLARDVAVVWWTSDSKHISELTCWFDGRFGIVIRICSRMEGRSKR